VVDFLFGVGENEGTGGVRHADLLFSRFRDRRSTIDELRAWVLDGNERWKGRESGCRPPYIWLVLVPNQHANIGKSHTLRQAVSMCHNGTMEKQKNIVTKAGARIDDLRMIWRLDVEIRSSSYRKLHPHTWLRQVCLHRCAPDQRHVPHLLLQPVSIFLSPQPSRHLAETLAVAGVCGTTFALLPSLTNV
jgi:hypothetical protein